MKKFVFLLSTLIITCTCVLTSCFSSDGEMTEPNIPHRSGIHGVKVSLTDITHVDASSQTEGLKGHAVVQKETARILVDKGWDGILIYLEYCKDDDLSPLKNPSDLVSGKVKLPTKAKVVQALCLPPLVSFPAHPIRLTVETNEAEGTSLSCSFNGMGEDTLKVTTNAEGANVDIPHFSYWVFTINFNLKYIETRTETSDLLTVHCAETNRVDELRVNYEAPYGFRTDVKNPFVLGFLMQYCGKANSITGTHSYHCTKEPGVERYRYNQKVYVFELCSGSRSFKFEVYDKPVSEHVDFVSDSHDGGSGMNP